MNSKALESFLIPTTEGLFDKFKNKSIYPTSSQSINKDTSTEEKNNAYNGLKEIDEIKAKEDDLENKVKKELKLDSFIKIDGSNVSVTIKKKDHDYSLANNVMRLISKEFKTKVYVSVKFQK